MWALDGYRESWKQRDIDLFVCAFATSLLALIVKEIDGEMGSHGLHCFFLLHAFLFAVEAVKFCKIDGLISPEVSGTLYYMQG